MSALTYLTHAELALAAYGQLPGGIQGAAYEAALQGAGMTSAQAEKFSGRWRVVDQYNHSDGLSITVFEERESGVRRLAIRGTNDLVDIATDIVDIAVLGTPERQAQYQSLKTKVDEWRSDGTLSGAFTVAGHSLGGFLAGALLVDYPDVVDHAFLYNAPGLGGIRASVGLAVQNLRGVDLDISPELDLTKVSNVKALSGVSPVAGLGVAFGVPIPIIIEDQFFSDVPNPPGARNHSQEVLTDTLALYELLQRVDANVSIEQIATIVRAASHRNVVTTESVIDVLGRLVGLPSVNIEDREGFHATIAGVAARLPTQGLTLATLLDIPASELTLRAGADNGLAYRYAIAHLDPFVVLGPNSLYETHNRNGELDLFRNETGQGQLTAEYTTDRVEMLHWKNARNLNDLPIVADPAGPARDYQDYRIEERIVVGETVEVVAADLVRVGGGISRKGLQQIAFGSSSKDSLRGFGQSDRIYAGAGDDVLVGQGGDDFLEGGTGRDVVSGGFGNDTLLGGADDDILQGAAGADVYRLQRDGGRDQIVDRREDGQQIGEIWFDGEHLLGAGEQDFFNRETYTLIGSAGGTYTLTFAGDSGSGGILNIFRNGDSSIVTVLDFRSGDFGIELTELPQVAMTDQFGTASSDNSASTQVGQAASLQSEVANQRVYGLAGNDRILVSHTDAEAYGGIGRDYITNGVGDQKLYGEEDDDILIASTGNDLLDGGTGNDVLQGGADDDVLIGGEGNDFIDGGIGSDAISGGDGHDFIVGGGTMTVTIGEGALDDPEPPQFGVMLSGGTIGFAGMTGLLLAMGDGSNAIDAGAGNDVVIGGDATDYVEGGLGDDSLLGFAGMDSLFGDDGDDTIFGDVTQGAYSVGGQALYTVADAHASDYLDGGAGNDTLSGDGGDDELVGGEGNDLLLGDDGRIAAEWHGADYLDGDAGDDQLIGHGNDDVLFGGAGNDQLDGDSSDTSFAQHGTDYLDGEDGDDILKGSGGGDTLFGGDGADQLFGDTDDTPVAYQGDDYLDGGAGNDYLRAYGGADVLYGGDGDDEMLGELGDDYLDGEAGDDRISGGEGADYLVGGAGADDLQADAGDDVLDGGEGDDLLSGGAGSDTAHGGTGNDQLAGNEGNDVLRADEGDDSVLGEAGNDTLDGGAGLDTLLGGIGNDTLSGGDGADLLAGEDGSIEDVGGDDRLDGGAGADSLLGEGGSDTLVGGAGGDYVAGGSGADSLDGGDDDDLLFGESGDDSLAGGAGADVLQGGANHDTLEGSAGDDLLYGGAGDDLLAGGDGNDAYFFDNELNGTDRIVDSTANGDTNTLILPFLYGSGVVRLSLGSLVVGVGPGIEIHIEGFDPNDPWANVAINRFQFTNRTLTYKELLEENPLFITGTPEEDELSGTVLDDVLVGLESDDVLLGKSGDDSLSGSAGADTLVGGEGDDAYREVDAEDLLFEQAGEGHDRVETLQRTYTLPENIEDLIVLGVGGTADLTGNDLANTITVNSGIDGGVTVRGMDGNDVIVGSAGSDTLDGGEGSNHLAGRGGDDIYVVNGADQTYIFELAGDGHDTVLAYTSVGLPLDSEVEDVFLMAGSGAISVVGNGLRNHLVGNELANIMYGEVPGNASDGSVPTTPLPPGTIYQVLGSINDAEGDLMEGGGGDDFLDGGGHSDVLRGDDGNDVLVGQVGADLLEGDAGNDTLDASRVLTVVPGQGIVLVGDDGSLDTMDGGEGDDYYLFGDSDDVLVEAADAGIDAVETPFSYSLAENFENLVLTGEEALVGRGNAIANLLRDETQLDPFSGSITELHGESGDDTLIGAGSMDGGTGADVMIARAGMSTMFIVDDTGDQVIKAVIDGHFAYVESSVSHALATNIDNLTLTGNGAVDGYGNERANVLVGNEASNHLVDAHDFEDTALFRDLLYGMGGDDVLSAGAGRHLLDGGTGNDTLYAGAGDDLLDGGEGADVMWGGAGNDVFHVDSEADTTVESADEGYDTVYSGVNHALGANLEALYMLGELDLTGDGNELDNLIVGNWGANLLRAGDGDDHLDGGVGADVLQGGAGDDVYFVDTRDDVVLELANEGIDNILAWDDVELADNVENLTLRGDFALAGPSVAGLDADGNDLANAITGNEGDNNLDGRGGDDRIDGRAGSDDIEGEDGNDILIGGDDALYYPERSEGKVPLDGDSAFLARNADSLYGGQGNDSIDGGSGDDRLFGDDGDDVLYGGEDGLVADAVFEQDGEEGGGDGGFEENGGRVFLTNNDYLEGGDGDDFLDGGSGEDALYGGDGDDYLYGGDDGPLNTRNDDFLDGGEGSDTLSGGSGDDRYVLLDGTYVETTDVPVYGDCGTLIPDAVTRIWTHDQVIESAGGGFDTVFVLGDYTLPEYVEELILDDHADARIGRGNTGDNSLQGNNYANRLEGLGGRDQLFGGRGDDVLDGGAGDDDLIGGAGNDIYLFGRGYGRDRVIESGDGSDTVHLVSGLTLADVTLSTNGSDVTIGINGTRDRLVLDSWLALTERTQSIVFCDGMVLDEAAIAGMASGRVLLAEHDSAVADEDGPAASGSLLHNDVSSHPESALTIAEPGSYVGHYGTLAIALDGTFSYLAGDGVAWLAEGESISERFEYVVQDDANANDRGELEVTIIGRNDAPFFGGGDAAGSVAEDAISTLEGEELLVNGALEDSDFYSWRVDGDTDFVGDSEAGYEGSAAYFGAISEETTLSQDLGTTAGATYLVSFFLKGGADADAAFNASWNGVELVSLADESLSTYTEFRFLVASDAGNVSTLRFALRNDPAFWYLDEVSVRQVESLIPEVQRASGALEFSDFDGNDFHAVSAQAQADGYLGGFEVALDADTGWEAPGSIGWSFAVDNADLQLLAAGETVLQHYDVTVTDAFGGSAVRTVSIALAGTNDGPEAFADAAFVEENQGEATGNVLENDTDPDRGTLLRVTSAGTYDGQFGTLTIAADGDYRYQIDGAAVQHLAAGDFLSEVFSYQVTDGALTDPGNAIASLTITITGINDAPVAVEDLGSVQEDGVLVATGNVLVNDFDVDEGEAVSLVPLGVFEGTYGTLVLEADGGFRYELTNDRAVVQALAAGQSPFETFTYEVTDGATSSLGTVRIAVHGANDAPGAAPDGADVAEDGVLQVHGNVLDNDSDIDEADTLAAVVPGTYQGVFGTLVLAADGAYTYVLDNGADAVQRLRTGDLVTDVFAYAADDGMAQTPGTLIITVAGANDLPIAIADTASILEDATGDVSGNVLANDSDRDRDTTLTVAAPGAYAGTYGVLTLATDGSYSYALDNAVPGVQALRQGQVVHDEFSYQAGDGTAQAAGILSVGITGMNDAPTAATPIADQQATAGTPFTFVLSQGTFADVDVGDVLAYSASLADGSALPAWLVFDAAARRFAGTSPQGGTPLQIRVTARDSAGATASDDFELQISAAPDPDETGELIVGTDGNDTLAGTAGDDVIDGREGFDKMGGGKGNDSYFVDEWCGDVDKVVEHAGEGRDTAFALVDYTLSANVEDVYLLGCEDIDATGNALENVVAGNEGDNVLSGRAGPDTYAYSAGGGKDVIDEKGVAGEVDTLKLQGLSASKTRLKRSGDDMIVDFAGEDGRVTLKKWFTSSTNRVERFEFGDGTAWDETAIRSRVGKPVSASKSDHHGGSSGSHGHDGHLGSHHGHHDRRDRDDHRHYGRDRDDGARRDGVDEALDKRLKQPVRFDFEEVTRALGNGSRGGRTMTAAEIAQRWAEVQRYTECLNRCGDDQSNDADIAQLRNLFGVQAPQHGHCFGFEDSIGDSSGPGKWFKALEGLCEGFRRL
jgi:VCBS repeat-containing protein